VAEVAGIFMHAKHLLDAKKWNPSGDYLKIAVTKLTKFLDLEIIKP
jgi:hypothetical protein